MADEPKDSPGQPPPEAAADRPPSAAPGEPLKGEVSRTETPAEKTPDAVQPGRPATVPAIEPPAPTAAAPKAPVAPGAKPPPAAPKPAVPAEHAKPAAIPQGPSDPAPPPDRPVPAFISAVQETFGTSVEQVTFWVGDWSIIVGVERLLEVARFLRDDSRGRFDFLSDVTASDWPPRGKRFDVIYCLYSTSLRHRVRIKVRAAELDPVPSVTSIWPSANWLEREVFDLFGVNFTGHPDRRRILMPDDWQGHPQRKDYPLEGPGELLMENPIDWLKLRQARDEAEISDVRPGREDIE